MYIDPGEILRVRVEADEFYDDEPGPPKANEGVQQAKTEARRAPYTITVSQDLTIGQRRTNMVAVLDSGAGSRPCVLVEECWD